MENKGPETVKTEMHLITVELPSTLPALCWNNTKPSKYLGEDRGKAVRLVCPVTSLQFLYKDLILMNCEELGGTVLH